MESLSPIRLDQRPAQAWTLRKALPGLLTDPHQQIIVAALSRDEGCRDAAGIKHYRSVLWEMLRAKLVASQALVTGFAPAATSPSVIHPDFVSDAMPDFDRNTLTLGGVSYHGIRVMISEELIGEQAMPVGRKPPVSHKEADSLLVKEMRHLIDTGSAKGIQDAARLVVDRAPGRGTPDSKVKRLTGVFSRSGQSGQY